MPSDATGATRFAAIVCGVIGSLARRLPPFKGKCRAGRTLAGVLLGHTGDARLKVRLRDGSCLWLDPRGRTEAGAYFNGFHDEDDIAFFKCCLDPDAVVLDIGANVGLIAIPLARHLGQNGRLLAIEPVAPNAAALRNNFELNAMPVPPQVVECALGDQNGTLRIGRETGNGASTGNAFSEASAAQAGAPLDWSTVPLKRLDDLVDEWSLTRLDLIKIDVEGAEVDVLRGGRITLHRYRPVIYGEFQLTLRPQSGDTFATVGEVLAGLDYQPFAFADRLRLVPVEFKAGIGNAVLCPAEKVAGLLQRCDTARSLPRRP